MDGYVSKQRTGLYLVSLNKKVRKGRWHNPATRREAQPFRGLRGRESERCIAATEYPTDSSIKIICMNEARCAIFKSGHGFARI